MWCMSEYHVVTSSAYHGVELAGMPFPSRARDAPACTKRQHNDGGRIYVHATFSSGAGLDMAACTQARQV